jgi:acetyl-CoA carboxylase biotin carboxyl carrier protein
MSALMNTLQSAIDDARALLDTLLASDWQEIHVASGTTEIFIARDGGRPNPMRQAAVSPVAASGGLEAPEEQAQAVTAPHVATIVSLVAIGTQVDSGARIATIRVLDTEEVVAAPWAGTVTAIHADVGALVEFKTPILSLGASSR